MSLAAGTKLGPYEILAQLGAGGMGEVYRARDSRIGREVALKVLPTARSQDPEWGRRFEAEARSVAKIAHPSILTIFDVGRHEHLSYLVFELLNGETLRRRLSGSKLIPRQAIEIGIELARGLVAAHEHGVVHRDLKPENLFLTSDGRLKILDFGVAKLMEPTGGDEGLTDARTQPMATMPGVTLGTAGYAAPEQVRGLPVDHRSDIFSFGAVLYEMIDGRRAFVRDSLADTWSAVLNEDPPPFSSNLELPTGTERIIRRCLDKQPIERFQSTRDLVFSLEGLLLDSATVRHARSGIPSPGPDHADRVPCIAVLPFDDLSPAKDSEYFGHGLTDEITASLSKLQSLQVLSRASALKLKASGVSEPEGAMVDFRLEGSVRKAEQALRITAQLIDTSVDRQVWGETYRGTLDEIFDIQEQVASEIVAILRLRLSPLEKAALSRRATSAPVAFDRTLRGRFCLRAGTRRDLETAVELFQQALAEDPRYAEAYAGLSEAYATLFEFYDPSPDRLRQAVEMGAKAVLYDPNLPDAYAALGLAHYNQGELEEALAACRRAIELRPNEFIGYWIIGRILHVAGRPREAVEHMHRVIERNPEHYPAYFLLRMLYRSLGERTYLDEILPRVIGEVLPRHLERFPHDARARNSYGTELSHAGRIKEGRAEVDKALAESPDDPLILYATACYYAVFVDREEALDLLKSAVKAGFRNFAYMRQDPDLESLRGELAGLEQAQERRL